MGYSNQVKRALISNSQVCLQISPLRISKLKPQNFQSFLLNH